MMNRKAISLLSGGLDSILSTKLVLDQGIDVVALHFTSPLASRRDKERGLQAVRTAKELGVRLLLQDKGPEYLEVLRNPKYGYGKNMNPCIDCRIFMLRKTREIMAAEEASFVVTGEVLGQRPMSQRRDTISLIEKESGLDGLILRPLSARLFPPTLPEQEGIVSRESLLAISGRSRAEQFRLAESYHLKEFGCPGGGCLLTDPIFSVKLREHLSRGTGLTMEDLSLLSMGRHFRLPGGAKLVVGRNQDENERIRALRPDPSTAMRPLGFTGPAGLLLGPAEPSLLALAANILAYYGKSTLPFVEVEVDDGAIRSLSFPREEPDVESMRV